MSIKGYKVFNSDWTCRDFVYEVGKTYKHNGDIGICKAGFHFCRKASDCFQYYKFDSENKVAEVEAIGLVESDNTKSVTDEIKIVREIEWRELLTIVNEGDNCTGLCNTGDCNTGNRNTGNRNTGDWNTGDWNTGDWNTGFFCTTTPNVRAFNKQTNLSFDKFKSIKGVQVLNWKYENNWWIYSQNMSDEEKTAHPEYECTGGYLKTVDFKTACKMMWDNLDADERQAVREIPNFSAKIFKEITGIDVGE